MSGVIVLDPAELFPEFGEAWRDIVLRALRSEHPANEFATLEYIARAIEEQTPPLEPTGLGAVAEDAAGVIWVRVIGGQDLPWTSTEGWATWSDIKVVRVLSEGIRP